VPLPTELSLLGLNTCMAAAFLTVHFVRWKTKRKEPLAVQVILSRPVNGIPVMGVFEPPNAKDLPVLELDGGSAADPSISCQPAKFAGWGSPHQRVNLPPTPGKAMEWNPCLHKATRECLGALPVGCGSRNTKDQQTGYQRI